MRTSRAGFMQKLSTWLGLLASFSLLSLMAACGGGGGSPGTNFNGQQPSKASTVVLTASAATIPSSGQDGTEVTLTAVVKDGSNNVLPGETVSFKSSSGNISATNRVTDTDGKVVEKLNVKGDSSARDITITASAGGATSNTVTVKVVTATPTVVLTADSGTLQSAGATGAEVALVALVKDSNNSVMPGVKVDLSADSGSLTTTSRITDANGRVTEKLSTGGDPSSRAIKVTASVQGATPTTTVVNVIGTRLQVNASGTVNVGGSSDVTVKLVDSAGNALIGKPVSFSSSINQIVVKDGGAAVTNSAGQLILSYTASTAGGDTIVVRALGETATAPIVVSASVLTVTVLSGQTIVINACHPVAVHSDTGSAVTLNTSRGNFYSNAGCSVALNGALALSSGDGVAYLSATSPGQATLTATNTASGATAQSTVEFVAPLSGVDTINVQADPAVVAANAPGSSSQQVALRAVVRDGSVSNNLVKGAQVAFSILADPSGGQLTQPSVVTTGSDGAATVSYVAGTSTTAVDGVQIMARLIGGSNASAIARLTVGRRSLFISAGTGNTVQTPDAATYRMDYSVFVSDAAGAAVPGVNLTASIKPRFYYKGFLAFQGSDGPWAPSLYVQCANEDSDGSGIYSVAKDLNGNGRLDPGIPLTITANAVSDARGQATISLSYPRDRVYWVDADMTIRGQVAGTEARYVGYVSLIGLATDYNNKDLIPPGQTSPYGKANVCTNPN
ncbi:hypothetical protein ACZ75_16425 [Massilia sp. NR 4-1]|nr:hypothetical protein ACZ75_16425 [Massilia sp. NR 4-1]